MSLDVKHDEDFQGITFGRKVIKPGMLLVPPLYHKIHPRGPCGALGVG